jgi:hypothetical protein
MEPKDNGLMMAAFYGEFTTNIENAATTQACQITGRDCSFWDTDGGEMGVCDCRRCYIPIMAAIYKVANMGRI